jgi:hypothetical protein
VVFFEISVGQVVLFDKISGLGETLAITIHPPKKAKKKSSGSIHISSFTLLAWASTMNAMILTVT